MSIHRYPVPSLLSDSIRAIFGMAMTFGPLFFLDVAWPLALVLSGLGLVFLAFALRLILQSSSPIELSSEGISRLGPAAKNFPWTDVTSLKLAHYGAPKTPANGWYQLKIRGAGGVLTVDSTIEGFEEIIASAASAVARGGLVFDPATSENLKSLGHGTSHPPIPV